MTGCGRCTGITPDQVDELAVVGGSHYPFSEPYGQLRTCRGCGGMWNDVPESIRWTELGPERGKGGLRLEEKRRKVLAELAAQ